MALSKSLLKISTFLTRHKVVITAIMVALLIILSFVIYDAVTTPPSQVPVYSMTPQKLGSSGFTYNGTTYPYVINETKPSFFVSFELMQSVPIVVKPGYFAKGGVGLSILNDSVSSPLSVVTFFVNSANLTIGNYTTNSYHLTGNGFGQPLGISFTIDGSAILEYDQSNSNYTGLFTVTLTPVLHYGLLYFAQKVITLNFQTQYPWAHIS